MHPVIVFIVEVVSCIAISVFILTRLQRLLLRIGAEVCERGGAATEFWVAYTQLMMLIAPVLLVAWFSRAGQHYLEVEQLKSSVVVVLFGQFAGLALVGRAVWKSIARPEPAAQPAPVVVAA